LWGVAADAGDVAVVGAAEVAFKIALDFAGHSEPLGDVGPLKVSAKTGGTRLDVKSGVGGWAGIGVEEARKDKVIAARVAGIMSRRRLDEAEGVNLTAPNLRAGISPSFTGGSSGSTRTGATAGMTVGPAGFSGAAAAWFTRAASGTAVAAVIADRSCALTRPFCDSASTRA